VQGRLINVKYDSPAVAFPEDEYSLKGIENPIGISEYHLTKAVPSNLKSSLPSIAEIENKLK
jgi:hypothetical protein